MEVLHDSALYPYPVQVLPGNLITPMTSAGSMLMFPRDPSLILTFTRQQTHGLSIYLVFYRSCKCCLSKLYLLSSFHFLHSLSQFHHLCGDTDIVPTFRHLNLVDYISVVFLLTFSSLPLSLPHLFLSII